MVIPRAHAISNEVHPVRDPMPKASADAEGRLISNGVNSELKTNWDLGVLFAGDDDPWMEEERSAIKKESYAFINQWKDRADYLEDPAVLRQALDEYETWQRRFGAEGNQGYYFWLRSTLDEADPKIKARVNQIQDFSKKIENDIQFFTLRIAKIPESAQKIFLSHKSLTKYRHFLERLFAQAKYLLSEPEEKILNLKAEPSHSNWVKMTSSFLSKEERGVYMDNGKATKNFAEILSLIDSPRKEVRDSAASAFNEILAKHVETGEAEINSVLLNKKIDDELRGVSRPDLLRHLDDDIETEVVDTLVEAVASHFDISRKFYELKAKLLGVKKLAYHERNVPLGKLDKNYTFAEAAALVERVFTKLDKQFADIFADFLSKSQIDAYPKKGKRSGAFCAHHLLSQPTYIFLNHTNKLNDVLTLAHELGHGINNELIREKVHALDFGTPLSTAEVASTFMEDFVLEELLLEADDESRLALMMTKLGDDVSTIFRQVASYRLEIELHQEFGKAGYLSKDEIGKIFLKHMASYMGDAVLLSPGSENWWLYWDHLRRFFYNYSYANGLLISKALQKSVRQDPAFINKVKEFLSAGLSDSPQNIFGNLGINIQNRKFWEEGLQEVRTLLDNATELAVKLGRI